MKLRLRPAKVLPLAQMQRQPLAFRPGRSAQRLRIEHIDQTHFAVRLVVGCHTL